MCKYIYGLPLLLEFIIYVYVISICTLQFHDCIFHSWKKIYLFECYTITHEVAYIGF